MQDLIKGSKDFDLTIEALERRSIIVYPSSSNKGVIHIKKDATLDIYNVVLSDKDLTIDEDIYLDEEGSSVNLINLIIGSKSKVTTNFCVYHNKPNTTSDLASYAIAKDDSKITLNNNAKIEKGCKGTIVHQKAKGLTLAKNAEIIAQPNLFIDEFDVTASHAASIGSINKEDLFYLTSRGLSQEDASRLIVTGFVKPIIDKIDDESLKKEINDSFLKLV